MLTLTTAPVAALLDRLVEENAAAHAATISATMTYWARYSESKIDNSQGTVDYSSFSKLVQNAHLSVSWDTGALLYTCARLKKAEFLVEFGTSCGFTTVFLAAALRDNIEKQKCKVITAELDSLKVHRAKQNLQQAGLCDLVEFREGDALKTLSAGLPNSVDMLFLNGPLQLYVGVLKTVEPCLQHGAVVVATGADVDSPYVSHVRASESGYMSFRGGDNLEVSLRACAIRNEKTTLT